MTDKHALYQARRAGRLTGWFRQVIHPPKRILDRYIRVGDTVLDLGCGPGYFSIPMAKMVGDSGLVIAADVQDEMLALCREAAEREGVVPRIRFHKTTAGSLALDLPPVLFFTLAFYVLHETADQSTILGEIFRLTRPGGLLFIVEPISRVGSRDFESTIEAVVHYGWTLIKRPFILLSRSVLLQRGAISD